MRILVITPGTGSFFCGVCLRDNALVQELRRLGHRADMLPMYLPIAVDDPESVSANQPIFFGGINVYLQHKFAFFRHTPHWLDAMFDARWLLERAAQQSGMTQGPELGRMTFDMLRGEAGHLRKEVRKLVAHIRDHERPDVIFLSTILQAGVARELRRATGVPVVGFLQGEDSFLDTLAAPWSERCWDELGVRCGEMDRLVAPTRYFGDLMAGRLKLPPGKVAVVPNGMKLEVFENIVPHTGAPTIGYLARMMPGKGLGTLVDAFLLLHRRGSVPGLKLRVAGALTPPDEPFVNGIKAKVTEAGLAEHFELKGNITLEEKREFFEGLSVFSVPATYGEAFGLYVVEAMAAGVPVVQPRHASFPELIEHHDAGRLCAPNDAASLADELEAVLTDPDQARQLGANGRRAAFDHFTAETMATRLVEEVGQLA
ncbi:MAG: glycosyltransferase family 4 protein [Verrucomicrobiota bacterium]